ncbi:hypothetical protein S245_011458 [Arachis hypogaea]
MRVPSSVLCYFLPLLLACCAAKKSYVVYMGAHSHDPAQLSPLHFNRVTHSHHQFLQSFLESYDAAKESIFYSYTRHINGFAAILEEEVAVEIAKHPKVISVFENRERKLHTTRSWEFMGLEQNGEVTWNSIWKKARYGEGVIIGNLDTGVWPESESFNEKGVLCLNGTLDPKKVKGKIVLCLRGSSSRAEKGEEALLAGAVGMVLANDKIDGNEILADPHLLPASHVNFTDGLAIFDYINSTKFPVAYITYPKTLLHTKPAPFMASFSSKGPNILVPEILKPDITAPGVSVIAAYTEAQGPTNEKFDKRRIPYNSLSGTSMSCPHISGIVGLLKTMYPSWSPAAIKSAIMTTATTLDNEAEPLLNAANRKATPFSYGAGHVDPNSAMDPGLVYDTTMDDYLNFLCALGYHETQLSMFTEGHHYKCATNFSILNLNYPSITVPEFPGSLTLTRTLKNVGAPATYFAQVQNPSGITVSVKPNILEFKEVGEEKSFEVTLKGRQGEARNNHFKFGKLIWSDGNHYVKSPIVVKSN